ncbi:GTPase IMAP family member 4-like [Astyanax mexicanus]|uniref:GTPase IMAP family member 4-like n=1 Tax=Astyanax mexicanus TaxID=7994 RepID=A0A8B9GTI4_ASTMX|nr:GTPase IMAP family member 4-like [Astyanax mexicanus]
MASNEGHPTTKRRRQSIELPPTVSFEDTSLRIVVTGHSGLHQYSLTESILQKAIFTGADPDTTLTTKTPGKALERDVVLVNTPNLNNHSLSHDALKKEFRKSVCFSSPGPHAFLFILHPSDIPSNACEIFQPVVQHFGESVLNHTVVVLHHNGEVPDNKIKTEGLKELLKKCNQNYFIFNSGKNREGGIVTRQLFDKIDEMFSQHGLYSNQEFKEAEKRIQKEEKYIEKERGKEIRRMLEELKKNHSGEDLEREVKLYQEKIQSENREKAEKRIAERLGFTLRLVDYISAIGKGALVGAALGLAMGMEGAVIGASVGAALGAILGGAVGRGWNYFTGVFGDAHRDYT